MTDHILRAMTDDGAFRVMTLRATETVQAVIDAQGVRGATANALGEAVLAAVLVRETMAPGQRVQVHYADPAGGRVIGDSHRDGRTRGLAQVQDAVLGAVLRSGGLLEVYRILRAGHGHQGVIETSDDGGLTDALGRYFLQSEQVTTMLGLAVVLEDADDARVRAAGGYVVQLLPEISEPPLLRMRARVDALGSLEDLLDRIDADPAQLMARIVGTEVHTQLADSVVEFGCQCSKQRVVASIATLGREDLADLLHRGEVLAVKCDYCGTLYEAGPEDYRALLAGMGDSALGQ
jgi:molecular chaperone Hsp33